MKELQMARRTLVQIECDLDSDGSRKEAETVTFYSAKTGQEFELDLCEEHRNDLTEVLDPVDDFTGLARKIGPRNRQAPPAPARRGRSSSTANGASPVDPKLVREWAKETGIDVNERGRLSAAVVQQYQAAH
jgi:hypothetical protein